MIFFSMISYNKTPINFHQRCYVLLLKIAVHQNFKQFVGQKSQQKLVLFIIFWNQTDGTLYN